MKRKINPFSTAYDQYQKLAERSQATSDVKEKNLIFRRRINLLGVMAFLLLNTEYSSRQAPHRQGTVP